MSETLSRPTVFGRSPALRAAALTFLFALGLGVRLIELTNPPLDEGYRYLNSALIARGMYYQMQPGADAWLRQQAIAMWRAAEAFEPPIFERIVALTYLFTGGERLWLPRLYGIMFWLIGGAVLYRLAQRLAGADGALGALAFYLLVPLGVFVSRRFQPDAFMVMWMLLAALALDDWRERQDWKRASLAGVACGMAVLVKIFAVFAVAGMAVAVVLASARGRVWLRNRQVWAMAAVMTAIPAAYYLLDSGARSADYFLFWNVSFAHLLAKPWFYVRWLDLVENVVGVMVVCASLAGMTIAPASRRPVLMGWWVGYFLFGLAFPWQIHTHDYYSLMLIPIVGLSLAPLGALFFERLAGQSKFWQAVFLAAALLALAYPAWSVRLHLVSGDQRVNWRAWEKIGAAIPKDGEMIALTQDYGVRVKYFAGREVFTWPYRFDYDLAATRAGGQNVDFEADFARRTAGMTYFLVTDRTELEAQPLLKDKLYAGYRLVAEGDGYMLFDLREPKGP